MVGFTEGKRRVGILSVIQRIGRFLVETSSGDTGSKYLEYGITYRSLVPEDSSGVSNREGVIWSRIGTYRDNGDIQRFGDVRDISDTCGVSGFGGVSSY